MQTQTRGKCIRERPVPLEKGGNLVKGPTYAECNLTQVMLNKLGQVGLKRDAYRSANSRVGVLNKSFNQRTGEEVCLPRGDLLRLLKQCGETIFKAKAEIKQSMCFIIILLNKSSTVAAGGRDTFTARGKVHRHFLKKSSTFGVGEFRPLCKAALRAALGRNRHGDCINTY